MSTALRSAKRFASTVAGVGVTALVLAGCAPSGGTEANAPEAFTYLSLAENTAVQETLGVLSEDACVDQNEALPLEITTQPQSSIDQQIQLLAGQGALPVLSAAGNSPSLAADLSENGQLVDIGAALEELEADNDVLPAAQSTIEALYGGFYALPTELNIEGFWYNKQIFTELGLDAPETFEELKDVSAVLSEAGYLPLSAAGQDGWPLTRLIGNHIFRTLGADALRDVVGGRAELTDEPYVEAAAAIAELGAEGYFGPSVGSIDYTTAVNQFLSGDAGMFYMGSWVLGDILNPELNQIGAENVGFVAFPDVEGGEGSRDQLAANVGVPLIMSEASYSEDVASWLGCIAENYGSTSLEEKGVISGFTPNTEVEGQEPLVQEVQEQIAATEETVLWFEALFGPEATTTATSNAQLLVTGQMTPEEFMAAVQADL